MDWLFCFCPLFFLIFYFDKTSRTWFSNYSKNIFIWYTIRLLFYSLSFFNSFFINYFFYFINLKKLAYLIKWYTIPYPIFINLLLIDAGLYQSWGVRLDTTLLTIFKYSRINDCFCFNISTYYWYFTWILISYIFIKVSIKSSKNIENIDKGNWLESSCFL